MLREMESNCQRTVFVAERVSTISRKASVSCVLVMQTATIFISLVYVYS